MYSVCFFALLLGSIRLTVYIVDDQSAPLIPSESSISNAKQKRERLRGVAAEGSEDYISLSLTKQSDQPKGPHPGSRLMREDDELGEGDDGAC